MSINAYYPATYQPIVPQATPPQSTLWVDGIEAARSYPVPPGGVVILMDSQNPIVYKKSADPSGRPLPLEVYDLVRHEEVVAEQPAYVTQKEFSEFCERIEKAVNDLDYVEEVVRRPRKRRRHESTNEQSNHEYR